MIKRKGPHTIKSARCYTMAEASECLGVSLNTIRNYLRDGLPILRAERPFLIPGAELKAWLATRKQRAKQPLKPEQMLCLRCKTPQTPLGGMVDCATLSSGKLQLTGLCPSCGGVIYRVASHRQLPDFARFFEVKPCKRNAP
jgi:excisionase family DNA binding protein